MIDTPYTAELTKISELLDVGCNAWFTIQGFPVGDMLVLMEMGQLDWVERKAHDDSGEAYLVANVEVGRVDFTIFSDEFVVEEAAATTREP